MTTNEKGSLRGCTVFIHENGDTRRRWVQELTWYVRGKTERRLTGEQLPKSIAIRLGTSQKAHSVLELFDEQPSRPVQLERSPGWSGRDVFMAFVGIGVAMIGRAFLDAVARAMQ